VPAAQASLQAEVSRWNSIVASNPVDDNITNELSARQRLSDYNTHANVCRQVANADADLAAYRRAADTADSTADYGSIDEHLREIRQNDDAEVASFPSPLLALSNFTEADREKYFAAHQAAVNDAGTAVASAVNAARLASGLAAAIAKVSVHQSDIDLAKASDQAYGEARGGLADLSTETDPAQLFQGFDAVMSSVDTSIASANAVTHASSSNPVSAITEALPVASFEPFTATPAPGSTSDENASGPDPDAREIENAVLDCTDLYKGGDVAERPACLRFAESLLSSASDDGSCSGGSDEDVDLEGRAHVLVYETWNFLATGDRKTAKRFYNLAMTCANEYFKAQEQAGAFNDTRFRAFWGRMQSLARSSNITG
jgi:hypothetical protein